MLIVKGVYKTLKVIIYAVLNPFETFTISKGTTKVSNFMSRNTWIIIIIGILLTSIFIFIGYYEAFFKGVLGLWLY